MSNCRVLSVLGVSAVLAALTVAFIPLTQTKPAAKPAAKAGAKADAGADAAAGRPDAASGTYAIDTVHSAVIFRVKHMDVSWAYGRFNQVTGNVVLDAAHPEKSSVQLLIAVDSVDTANEKRDQHLKSPDFFSASEFPEITFESETVKALKDGALEVTGKLDMHGVTKPLTVTVIPTGTSAGDDRRPALAGFETTFTLKRSDFGMDNMIGPLGDEVTVTLSVETGKVG